MANDGGVQVPIDGSGKIIDHEIADDGKYRQRIVLVPGSLPHGCRVYHVVSSAGLNAGSIKGAPGQVYGYRAYNSSGGVLFIKLHDVAVLPTPGVGVGQTIPLQAGLPEKDFNSLGTPFATGIGVTIVKGLADNDVTPVGAGDCVVDIFWA